MRHDLCLHTAGKCSLKLTSDTSFFLPLFFAFIVFVNFNGSLGEERKCAATHKTRQKYCIIWTEVKADNVKKEEQRT